MASIPNLHAVDLALLPPPVDDGAAAHLAGLHVPDITLLATSGHSVSFADLAGRTVVYIYPMTGQPNAALPDGWDSIPGARGCTPQSCGFRDCYSDILAAGADHVFGLSVQDTAYQLEAANRLGLPFALISDSQLQLANEIKLPSFEVLGMTLLKRATLIIDGGVITQVFYPVFPPDQNASNVLAWLRSHARA